MVGQRVYQPRHDPWHFHTFPPQPTHLRQIKLISFPNILIWFDTIVLWFIWQQHYPTTCSRSHLITLWGIELAERFLCKCLCWVDYINEEQLSDKFGRPQTANLQFLLLTRPFWSESYISCLCESPRKAWCALSFLLFEHVICFQWQSQCNVGLWFGFLWWSKVLLQFVVFVIGPVVGWILMQNSWLQKSTGQIFAIFLITNFSGSAT